MKYILCAYTEYPILFLAVRFLEKYSIKKDFVQKFYGF